MFTGIIEEIGTIDTSAPAEGGGARLAIRGPVAVSDATPGCSIAVNGTCLTVVDLPGDDSFVVDLMPETLRRTSLGRLSQGSQVNLERAMRADARLDGHQVQGHVDGLATLLERTDADGWVELEFGVPDALGPLIAEKGAVALDGVSLTVTHVGPASLGVALIPETLRMTTLGGLEVGDVVNIEVDPVARYVERQLQAAGLVGSVADGVAAGALQEAGVQA
ncbi:riboflavin synthase [Propionibacterium freudenreichii]|uniref:riboflavin synthase n=1 Tax=Propionibacterium freudenreichii TaxID=1744 RepID=UPI0005A5CF1E|nr:riboflavin synthase [Propionibacterium freudenreichii]MDK9294995.1 riboflavin synthase [Propionibacterium freudenreichii]MDK9300442.1 riboflavin synthase [Propionibacterium freudenreichii]MDK9360363.1 riboflavin synthase [Propionibacterium freudenreichii]MDK9640047.1 riboflavin synthase [Propionibacterium freudenreichii]MDK9659969.1 riboflavin synthase [Propionibacterium freudenreichii]